ncbi:hypothetical protein [Xenorhabdus bovienii]|nr:hypothetical protein [Xenorhabdus bovienii]MDE9459687.1 hypothetical protein [Xenorhabdus bovienii]MDE9488035.1 hypothetical protein [Xenorhabdus bovienii]MDE9516006.1 hypothetical protein [Xenorhabdus bovienii]
MSALEKILNDLNEQDFVQAQDNVEVMRGEEGFLVNVRMIAYDDLV